MPVSVSSRSPSQGCHFTSTPIKVRAKSVCRNPLHFLLHDAPNPEMTSFIFRETMMSHLLLWGNAYAQILRDGRGSVIGLYPLLPDKMEVSRDSRTGELYYTYTRSTEENPNFADKGQIRLRREDVLHIPGLGFDGLVGYSPIAMAKNAIGIALATEEYGAAFFKNGARPGGVLEHPGVLKDLYDNAFNLENYLIEQFGKALGNAEEDAFLNGDGTHKPKGLLTSTKTSVTTAAADIKADELVTLVYSLKRPYRKNASFIVNDQTLASIRKLKDANGAYFWQPSYQMGESDRLLGYPVYSSAYMPAVEAGKTVIAFGDYSYYNIGDRGIRALQELKELFAGNGMSATS